MPMLKKISWLIAALTLPLHAEIRVSTDFEGGRHAPRVDKISQIESDDLC